MHGMFLTFQKNGIIRTDVSETHPTWLITQTGSDFFALGQKTDEFSSEGYSKASTGPSVSHAIPSREDSQERGLTILTRQSFHFFSIALVFCGQELASPRVQINPESCVSSLGKRLRPARRANKKRRHGSAEWAFAVIFSWSNRIFLQR